MQQSKSGGKIHIKICDGNSFIKVIVWHILMFHHKTDVGIRNIVRSILLQNLETVLKFRQYFKNSLPVIK